MATTTCEEPHPRTRSEVSAGTGINGDDGSDVILGGAGADVIFFDGSGADTIYGGLGNDHVYLVRDRTPDTVPCGCGHDVVWGATRGNTVAADCEDVHADLPACRDLPQRIPSPVREAARC